MADIEKIQPIGDTEQYTLRARTDSKGNVITDYYLPLKTAGGLKENSGGGSSTYFKLATLVITGGYVNRPIVFELSRRGYGFQKLEIMFASNSTNDPSLNYIRTDGEDLGFWINKTATSTWEVYGRYNESYGSCTVHRITGSATNNGVTVTLNLENIGTTQPEGTQARRGYSARYADTAVALNSNAGSSTVPIYFSSGKPVQCSTTLGISITGNAATATTLQTTRAIKIGNKSNNFNGSANITYTMRDMQIGPQYNVGSTSSNTYILVDINPKSAWMLNFTLKVYSSYLATDFQISGYNYGTNNWYSPQAVILGSTTTGARTVYFGYRNDAVNNYKTLWVAVQGGNYNGACVCNVCNGYGQIDLENAFTVSKVDSLPGTTQTTVTCYREWHRGESVTGAVWNDYAEYRESEIIEPGYILCEKGDGSLYKSTKRCQEFAGVSSDTWGFAQGETEKAKTPIAVSGRVLVYIKDKVKVNDYICSGPDGIGLKMHWWEKILYPHRIVGIVSEIPTYEKWGGGEASDRPSVDVNGRIWIKCCN